MKSAGEWSWKGCLGLILVDRGEGNSILFEFERSVKEWFCKKFLAISEIPNNRIAYNIRPVLGVHRFWPVQIGLDSCTLILKT